MTTKVGLRIDVDTFRGTKLGVPALLDILHRHDIHASFFFTMGPDNMGRHIWRLLRPAFLIKMLRSNAASLYGWDILLRGTIWPGPIIGRKLAKVIKQTQQAGHEIGLHAWDHHKWQVKVDKMTDQQLYAEINKGMQLLQDITGEPIVSSAVAGWRCTEGTLEQKDKFNFRYCSDCRGHGIFTPVGRTTPQIPVTLPTYDELIGTNGVNAGNFNQSIIDLIKPGQLNVYTIHAEVEGIVCARMFEDLLIQAKKQNIEFVPLIDFVQDDQGSWPRDDVSNYASQGREGWISHQGATPA